MKEDKSNNNFNYRGYPIHEIIDNPDEYIVPECLDACRKFWDKNIFTASCSNRRETIDENGNIRKYIMVSHLSDENKEIFENLIMSNPAHYWKREIDNVMYYSIVILSKYIKEGSDVDSQRLLSLAEPFKLQDCLEGYVTVEDYYKNNITYSKTISESEYEVLERVKKHLLANNKIEFLDLDRKVIYDCKFYKEAHQHYLDMLEKNKEQEKYKDEFVLE